MNKMKLFIGIFAAILIAPVIGFMAAWAVDPAWNPTVVDEPGLAYPKEVIVDLNAAGIKNLSAQVTASSTSFPAVTTYDGRVSTMQITFASNGAALSSAAASTTLSIASNTALFPAYAQNFLQVSSNSIIGGARGYDILVVTNTVSSIRSSTITMNHINYREGIEWFVGADSQTTSINISTSLTNNLIVGTTVSGNLAGVLFTARDLGLLSTTYDLSSSSNPGLTVSYSSFIAGVENTSFTLNKITLIQGRDWFKDPAVNAASGTILSIMSVIYSKFDTISLTTAGPSGDGSILFMRPFLPGTTGNLLTLATSSSAVLAIGGANFYGGTDQAISSFTIRGTTFVAGREWGMMSTASGTAVSIAFAINRTSATLGVKASALGAVVYATATAIVVSTDGVVTNQEFWGIIPNSWTVTSSTPTALLSSSTFSGGQNRATLVIKGVAFRNGLEWLTGSSSLTATTNLATALKANTTVSAYISVSSNGVSAVIYTSSVYVNQPFLILTTTQGAMSLSSFTLQNVDGSAYGFLQGGLASDISTTTNKFSKANSFTPGLPINYSTATAGNSLTGLSTFTTYYIKNPTQTEFYLSNTSSGGAVSSTANATVVQIGNFVNVISTGGGSFVFTPIAMVSNTTMTWSSSNDGVNFATRTSSIIPSVSNSSAPTTTLFDFGDYPYRYLRFQSNTGPAGFGAVKEKVTLNGRP